MKHMIVFLVFITFLVSGCASSSQAAQPRPPQIDTGIDPDSWTLITAGEFLMGLHEHEMEVETDYEIMVTDVTNAQFATFLNDQGNQLEGDAFWLELEDQDSQIELVNGSFQFKVLVLILIINQVHFPLLEK